MTYIKNNWKIGDTITANKLNNIENGIYNFNNDLFFYLDINNNTLNKTWNEINNAISNNKITYFNFGGILYQPVSIAAFSEDGTYWIWINGGIIQSGGNFYKISNPDGYPIYDEPEEPLN